MKNISVNIKNDLRKFYLENPEFYFFRIEDIINIYKKGRTIYNLKDLLYYTPLDQVRGHYSIYHNWLNNNFSEVDSQLFRNGKFQIGQDISNYREYFLEYEEIKSIAKNVDKIEFKAYGKSSKIDRSKIAFIGYFENQKLVKFDDLTSTVTKNFKKVTDKSISDIESFPILPYYKKENLLNYLLENDLTDVFGLDNFINAFKVELLSYKTSLNYLEYAIIKHEFVDLNNKSVSIYNLWKKNSSLQETLEKVSKDLSDLQRILNEKDLESSKFNDAKIGFDKYFSLNYSNFETYQTNFLGSKGLKYILITDIINFILMRIKEWDQKFLLVNGISVHKEFDDLKNSIQMLLRDCEKILDLNKNVIKKEKQKKQIRIALIVFAVLLSLVYFFI